MARRPASGRGWTVDGSATGKPFRYPLEAWWKHEGKNRCAILTILAQFGLVGLSRNRQDMRKKTRFVAPDCVSFDTTHNLKAAGSNPAPATKLLKHIRCLEPDVNRRVFGVPVLVNTWSTFCEPPIDGADNRAERGNHAAAMHAGSSQAQISAVTSASRRPSRAVPSE